MCKAMAEPTVNWYVLHVRGGRELEIADEINFGGVSGIRALCPTEIVEEWRKGHWKSLSRVIFPGYVFCEVQGSSTSSLYYAVKRLPGVIRWLGHGDGIACTAVPPEEMAVVLLLGNDGKPFGPSYGYKTGGRTHITSGPLCGMEHLITAVFPHRRRARLSIPLMGDIKEIEVTARLGGQQSSEAKPAAE